MFRDDKPVTDDFNIQLPSFEYGDDIFLNLSNDEINELTLILNKSKNQELFKDNLAKFYKKHYRDKKDFDKFYTIFLENIRKKYADILKDNSISVSDAIITTINGETSYLVMTLFGLLDVFSVTLAVATALTIAFGALTIATGVYIFVTEYLERVEAKKKLEDDFDFLIMKTVCAESIIYCREKNIRSQFANPYEDTPEYLPMPNPASVHSKYEEPSLLIRLKPAVLKAVMTFTMLLGTYFLGSAIILTAFGASAIAAAVTGPIGIGIAVGIAVAVGLFILYKQYQANKVSNMIEHLQENMEAGLEHLEENINENNITDEPQNKHIEINSSEPYSRNSTVHGNTAPNHARVSKFGKYGGTTTQPPKATHQASTTKLGMGPK